MNLIIACLTSNKLEVPPHLSSFKNIRMTGKRKTTSPVKSPTFTDEEELIRLLGFASLEKITAFISTRPAIDLHYLTQHRKLRTPLTAAIDRGIPSILKSLLDRFSVSLDSTTTQPFGKTALMHASYVSRNPEVIRVLIARGANVQQTDDIRGWNPLFYAIVGERTENVKYLIESGVDLESRDVHGRTPLMIAVILSNFGTAEHLLDHGADPKAIDDFGCSALRLAILRKKHEMAVRLAECGTDVTCKPSMTIYSDFELVKHLMPDLLPIIRQNTLQKQ